MLESAGADDADMLIALTNSDEINMIACQIASTLFHTPTKIARIRSAEYLRNPDLFAPESIPVDVMKEMQKAGTVQLHEELYSTVGNMGSLAEMRRVGNDIARDMLAAGINAVIVGAT